MVAVVYCNEELNTEFNFYWIIIHNRNRFSVKYTNNVSLSTYMTNIFRYLVLINKKFENNIEKIYNLLKVNRYIDTKLILIFIGCRRLCYYVIYIHLNINIYERDLWDTSPGYPQPLSRGRTTVNDDVMTRLRKKRKIKSSLYRRYRWE